MEDNIERKRLIFSLDLEDHTGRYRADGRFVSVTLQILDFLDQLAISGTFFIVGRVAESCSSLVTDIARRGHEIACHSYDHTPIAHQTPIDFKLATQRAKQVLEDRVGKEVLGYRAPIFSLTAETDWATEVLKDIGFAYSSSVLPARNPLYGYPEAPKRPFRWSSGLLEFPCPVKKWGALEIPYLGGIYLRYLPLPVIKKTLQSSLGDAFPWIYIHPYDFDHEENFSFSPGVPRWVSILLWLNRKSTLSRISSLFDGTATTTFGKLADSLDLSVLPEYEPVSLPIDSSQHNSLNMAVHDSLEIIMNQHEAQKIQ